MTTIFERLNRGRPAEPKIEQPYENHPQLLLDWLMQYWTNPDICLRDIRAYAPRPVRDEKIAISSAETQPGTDGSQSSKHIGTIGAFGVSTESR
jgi:hypothetical protein